MERSDADSITTAGEEQRARLQSRRLLSDGGLSAILPRADWSVPFCIGGASIAEQQTATCPQCSRMISQEDTIVFGSGRLGHLDCRRPRVVSAEERTLALLYCHDHEVAECSTCMRRFRLRELVSQDQFGVRLYACPWCHTDLTDAIRAHLYGCAMLPVEVRRRAQEARAAARRLVKQSQHLRDNADVLIREAEAALHALRATLRRPLAPKRNQ